MALWVMLPRPRDMIFQGIQTGGPPSPILPADHARMKFQDLSGAGSALMINIYVGNLPYRTTDQDLADLFAPHGTVDKASIIIDRQTGRSRGFGFVEMSNDEEGRAAVAALNGFDMDGRKLTVNEAKPREQSGGGGGRGGYGGGGRSGGSHGGSHRGYTAGSGYRNRNREASLEG